jgi:hypothetical protein
MQTERSDLGARPLECEETKVQTRLRPGDHQHGRQGDFGVPIVLVL